MSRIVRQNELNGIPEHFMPVSIKPKRKSRYQKLWLLNIPITAKMQQMILVRGSNKCISEFPCTYCPSLISFIINPRKASI